MFKKTVSAALAAMVLLTSAAFAYTDVAETDPDCEAITMLTDLGVLEGFADGSFRPDDTLTRAEAAKILVLALRCDPMPAISPFLDIPEDTDGWINTAYAYGIIHGCGDATFHPDDLLTYDEAVTMVVGTLGYGNDIFYYNKSDRFPMKYLECAEKLDILSGIQTTENKSAITRRQLARLLYNSLEVDMMVYSWGWPPYRVQEGYTLLNVLINTPKREDVPYPLLIKGVSASYMSESLNYPGLVADGNRKTDWTCWGESSVAVDLGDVKELGNIKLFVREYDDDRSLTLTLEISEDGENWTPIGTESYGGGEGYSSSTELDAQARYVRVNCNGTSVNEWVSLSEIEIYRK